MAGRQYNLGIVLNKTGINVTGCEIKPWEEVNGGTLQQNNKQTNNNQQL